MAALGTNSTQFERMLESEILSGNWKQVKSPLHKLSSLIVFRYHGTLFPYLVVEIVEHDANYKVSFDQPVSNGEANFKVVTDPRIVGSIQSTFGSSSFQLKGKAWHNVVDLSKVASGLIGLSKLTKKDFSFLLKFQGRPCGKIVGSTQFPGFFPSVDLSSVLIIEVSPMNRMYSISI